MPVTYLFIMAKGNMLLGFARRKIGDVVFYRANGEQVARARNRNPKNPRTEKQALQRMVLASASKTLQALRGLYDHAFESVAVGIQSTRYAQKLLMEGYRGIASAWINGDASDVRLVEFALKGAPIAGVYEGMPMTRGRLPFNEVTAEGNLVTIQASSLLDENITEATYAAELAKLGLEPGDQITLVGYNQNADTVVASFESSRGVAENFADNYRYCRLVFKAELDEGFSGAFIVDGAINPDIIDSTEGAIPDVEIVGGNLQFDFTDILPNGYDLRAVAVVRSQKTSGGKTMYSNANFIAATFGGTNPWRVFPSYMDGASDVNLGDMLYLRHAIAGVYNNPNEETSAYTITPALPLTTQASGSFTIKRNDGTPWSDSLVEALSFNIDGNWVDPNLGSSITWKVDSESVLEALRSQTTDTLTISFLAAGYTINGVR